MFNCTLTINYTDGTEECDIDLAVENSMNSVMTKIEAIIAQRHTRGLDVSSFVLVVVLS